MKRSVFFACLFYLPLAALPQADTSITIDRHIITLKEIVVRNGLNVASFIERVKNDTSFYKAFKNLKVLGFTALNDIRMMDKSGSTIASLQSTTHQAVAHGCRSTSTLRETVTGDIYDKNKKWNYYTAELYAGLLFAKGTICGETNIVKGSTLNLSNKKGIERSKEQLKMLFFNPGKKIPGIPFIGNKIAIFDPSVAPLYDFGIDMEDYRGQLCYKFTIRARPGLNSFQRDDIVINEMITWFNSRTLDISGRTYDISYDAAVYDFNVQMEVQLNNFQDLQVPSLIRYNGDWHLVFKKRERGVFTATIFDVTRPGN